MQLGARLLPLALAGLVLAGTAAAASTPPDTRPVREVQVQRDVAWRGGEPEIAVNPRDADNLVMVWAAMKNVETPAGTAYPGLAAQFASPVTGMQTIGCQMAYTSDGGRTWFPAPFPMRDKPACGDPMVVADSTGAFHITFDLMGSPFTPSTVGTQPVDQVAASRSRDGGRTWSTPVDVGTVVDRPFFRADVTDDHLYEVSGGLLSASSRKLTVSRDAGRTWSAPVAFPSDHLAVHSGLLATVLQTGNPARLAFALSRDDGATFAQSVVGPSTPGGTGAWVSADPTRTGRFAVMQQVGDVLQVLTTGDAGRTWSSPSSLRVPGRTVALPWMDYGPTGVLAVMWKAAAADGTFLVHSAVRRPGASTFSRPLRSSRVASRGADFLNEGAGDDLSWLTVGRNEVHLAWGDRRTGVLQAWTARVPLSAY